MRREGKFKMKLVKRTNVVLHLIDKHLLKIKEDKIDIFTHLVMNAGRQGKVRLENTLTFGMVIDSVVFIFPVAPVGPASNIHHVGFGGDGRGEVLPTAFQSSISWWKRSMRASRLSHIAYQPSPIQLHLRGQTPLG
jgi:hypothetical protein